MNQHLNLSLPSYLLPRNEPKRTTPALHPSSIAAGCFGATSTNSNSKLHQFRAVPSNSDQMTPQKSFSSPKHFPAAQLGSNKSWLPQNYERSRPDALMFERIGSDAPGGPSISDPLSQFWMNWPGHGGLPKAPKPPACSRFQASATFRHLHPHSRASLGPPSHQIAPNRTDFERPLTTVP
jgi:hypothetical protein